MKYFLLAMMLFSAAALSSAEPVFIANPKVADHVLSRESLSGILKGRVKSWPSGSRLVLVTLKEGNTHESVLNTYAGMSSNQFSSNWSRLVFTGKSSSPKSFSSEKALVNYVAITDNALGYVDRSAVTSAVKVVAVQ